MSTVCATDESKEKLKGRMAESAGTSLCLSLLRFSNYVHNTSPS
jgi:hypothetical protein